MCLSWETEWRKSSCALFFLLFPSSDPPWVPLETCPRVSTQPRTPQRWGLDVPSLCWRQEETPKVSRGWCSNILWQLSFFEWVSGGKSCRTASSLMHLNTESQAAVEALASILQGPIKYHVNALTVWHPGAKEQKGQGALFQDVREVQSKGSGWCKSYLKSRWDYVTTGVWFKCLYKLQTKPINSNKLLF